MARLEHATRDAVKTATEAVGIAADAVRTGRKAVKIARKAGVKAKGVAEKVVDRVTGKEAARRKKQVAIAAGVATAAVVAGVAVTRMRNGKARKRWGRS
jgi:hypothetical protein